MPFPYKQVVMVGATAGIGKAMADRLVGEGVKVIAVGRRQNRLDEFMKQHGEEKVGSLAFDISKIDEIPEFVSTLTSKYPDIDCVFLNAGVQNQYDFGKPAQVDLAKFQSEMHVNFTSMVVLTHAFLPFLMGKSSQTGLIFTTTHLAIIPGAPMPAYSASKAALNAFILCLREQLRESNVKVTEVLPPVVQTELHDYMGPEKGRKMGMPVEEFVDEAYKGLVSGSDEVSVGGVLGGKIDVQGITEQRRTGFEALAKVMRGMM